MSRPLVGVTGADGWFPIAWWFIALGVWLAGGRAVRMTPKKPRKELRPDALIISGGDDIDPGLYLPDGSDVAPMNPERDAFEIEMIELALKRDLPLLGICRGAQLINIVRGGALHTDLRRLRSKTTNRRTPFPAKTLFVDEDSRLARLLSTLRTRINSLHHQAVSDVGEGLQVVARDRDGITQAIEDPEHRFLFGVQWHPEYLPLHPTQRRLFQALIRAARKKAA